MARYQIILTYDGTSFSGFQKQLNARTVQGVVEEALLRLVGHDISVLAAGRTDTGVHASGQVLAFDLDWQHTEKALLRALNAHLPPEVAISHVKAVNPGFHPRYHATARWYRYHLFCQPDRDPLRERFAWRVWPAVDLELLHQAAAFLTGRHDFSAFGSPPHVGGSTIRTVCHARWELKAGWLDQPLLTFDVAADSFLYHMVRRLVSLQVEIGQGRRQAAEVLDYLDQQDNRVVVQGLAPAQGLFLTRVEYKNSVSENDCK
jgi:tRNA pseudouridine38-40 synthase